MRVIEPITPEQKVADITSTYLLALRKSGFIGDIDESHSGRLIAATDNSIYQQLPQAVIYPRSQLDVACALKLAQRPQFQEVRFSPRGGGTGTNGQSLTQGIVIDLSRYLTQVLEINVKEEWVRVEAGIVKDQLNLLLRPHGYFFAPDTSTSNRCTIGGMIATDASGQGSLVYGKTSDHVLGLRANLANGDLLRTYPMTIREAEAIAASDSSEGSVYRQVLTSCRENAEEIKLRFPPLNRFLTGYDLVHAYDEANDLVDVGRLICGAEGTLAVVTEAKLRIHRIPDHRILVNIKYLDFQAALRHAPTLVKAQATSVETVDSSVLDIARSDVIWHDVKDLLSDVASFRMDGINLVEFTGSSTRDIERKLSELCAQLDRLDPKASGMIGYQICRDAASIQKIYAMRKKAVGLLGATPGKAKPVAFVEDTAVPPEKLAEFIHEFRAILDRHGLHYGMFGHVDAGVLHVRPALDMQDAASVQTLRLISDQVVALTARYGGLMWGEHGRGYRSEYGPAYFGETLFAELRRIKSVFDGKNKLNPGKICTPIDSQEALVSIDGPLRGSFDREISERSQETFGGAMRCNGNGLCFNFDVNATMCPSFRVTGDRKQSPKGRASLLREWLRLHEKTGNSVTRNRHKVSKEPGLIRNLFLRSRTSSGHGTDFNHEVREALDSCLACKACSSQCPVQVDIPSQRALFYSHYHQAYRRPLKDFLVSRSESVAVRWSRFPRLANLLLLNPLSRLLQKSIFAYQDTPSFSIPSLRTHAQLMQVLTLAQAEILLKTGDWQPDKYVFIVQDAFTSAFDANVIAAFTKVARKLGIEPVLLPFLENGKAAHVKGFLHSFQKTASSTSAFLADIAIRFRSPLVGMDAATTLVYRDEYRALEIPRATEYSVQLVQEWIEPYAKTLRRLTSSFKAEDIQVLVHCTEQSNLVDSRDRWRDLLAEVGFHADAPVLGCCGMAGTFGHEEAYQEHSKQLWEISWLPKLQGERRSVATGFSCRCQSERLLGQKLMHPIEMIAQRLTSIP